MTGSEMIALMQIDLGETALIAGHTYRSLKEKGLIASNAPATHWTLTGLARDILEVLVRQTLRTGKILRQRGGEADPQNWCFDTSELLVLLSLKRAYPISWFNAAMVEESLAVLRACRLLEDADTRSLSDIGRQTADVIFASGQIVYETVKRKRQEAERGFQETLLAAYQAGTISVSTMLRHFDIIIDDETTQMPEESDLRHTARRILQKIRTGR